MAPTAPSGATPLMEQLAVELAQEIPAPTRVSVVHNDLKLDNCQFHPDTEAIDRRPVEVLLIRSIGLELPHDVAL